MNKESGIHSKNEKAQKNQGAADPRKNKKAQKKPTDSTGVSLSRRFDETDNNDACQTAGATPWYDNTHTLISSPIVLHQTNAQHHNFTNQQVRSSILGRPIDRSRGMNADYGAPTELAGPLQQRRALYQPRLPPCLQVIVDFHPLLPISVLSFLD